MAETSDMSNPVTMKPSDMSNPVTMETSGTILDSFVRLYLQHGKQILKNSNMRILHHMLYEIFNTRYPTDDTVTTGSVISMIIRAGTNVSALEEDKMALAVARVIKRNISLDD